MSIIIDKNLCVGCRKCKDVCPGNLIVIDKENKAIIKYPKDCWGCASCVKECKVDAIKYYLGADMGGKGSLLYVNEDKDIMSWIIEKSDKSKKVININKKNSNEY